MRHWNAIAGRLPHFGAAFVGLFALVAASLAHAASDPQDGVSGEKPRVAFVIGSNDYTGVPPLQNAINDAKLVATSLRRLNFEVIEGFDLTLEEMKSIFVENQDLINKADAVVLYYAGHAFQINGQNYLVPVDAELRSAFEIDSSTIRLDTVIRQLQSADRPTLIFLDACRDNPLPESVQLDTRQDGLAQIEAGVNTFVAFATQPGNVSNDGAGNNSPFALALSKHLETPGLSISDLVIEVRNETRDLTLGRQSPWDQSSLLSQFYFTERQQIDQRKLIAAFSAITQNETLRSVYEQDLNDNYSFQAAIFRTAHRAVTVLGEEQDSVPEEITALITDPNAPPAEPIQVAAAATGTAADVTDGAASATDVARSSVTIEGDEEFTVLGSLSFSRPDEEELDDAAQRERQMALARNMQTELQRLGCYRMAIDGLWGPGSRRAFSDYLQNTKQSADALTPSQDWLNRLVLHSGRVCRAPVKYTPAPTIRKAPQVASRGSQARQPARAAQSSKKVRSFRQRAVRGQSRAAKRARRTQRKNALPPDISMGVGIGL